MHWNIKKLIIKIVRNSIKKTFPIMYKNVKICCVFKQFTNQLKSKLFFSGN